jgi:hypothetical protein
MLGSAPRTDVLCFAWVSAPSLEQHRTYWPQFDELDALPFSTRAKLIASLALFLPRSEFTGRQRGGAQ